MQRSYPENESEALLSIQPLSFSFMLTTGAFWVIGLSGLEPAKHIHSFRLMHFEDIEVRGTFGRLNDETNDDDNSSNRAFGSIIGKPVHLD